MKRIHNSRRSTVIVLFASLVMILTCDALLASGVLLNGSLDRAFRKPDGSVIKEEHFLFEVWRSDCEWRIKVVSAHPPESAPIGPREIGSFQGDYIECREGLPRPWLTNYLRNTAAIYLGKHPFTADSEFMPLWIMFCADCGYSPAKPEQRSKPPFWVDPVLLNSETFSGLIQLDTTNVATSSEWVTRLDAFTEGVYYQRGGAYTTRVDRLPDTHSKSFHAVHFGVTTWGLKGALVYPKVAVLDRFYPKKGATAPPWLYPYETCTVSVLEIEESIADSPLVPNGRTLVADYRFSARDDFRRSVDYFVTNSWIAADTTWLKRRAVETYAIPRDEPSRSFARTKGVVAGVCVLVSGQFAYVLWKRRKAFSSS